MASAYYGLNEGQNEQDIVYSSSTNSTDMEFRVNLANVSDKGDALLALQKIYNYITHDLDAIWG